MPSGYSRRYGAIRHRRHGHRFRLHKAGEGCLILGTTICPEVVTTDPGRDGVPAGTTIALNEAGLYLRAMPTLTGCEALDWAASHVAGRRSG